jgi:integrase
MVLHMACPTKRKGSENWYYRRTIPADVRGILATLPRSKRPPGWYKTHIAISLRTADRAEAKAMCPTVAEQVERQMKALREGPKPLTPKQITALSGLLYKTFAVGGEEDPAFSPAQHRRIAQNMRAAQAGADANPLTIKIDSKQALRESLENRFGRLVDMLLNGQEIITTDESRWKLIEAVARDLPHASDKLARNAEGDYSPDAYIDRFPPWEKPEAKHDDARTLIELADAWRVTAIARMRKRSVGKWHAVALRFAAFLNNKSLRDIKREDVARWIDEQIKAGISPATINKSHLPALKVIFKWGADRGWLASNPLAMPLRAAGHKKAKLREKCFSQGEAAALLSAALSVTPTKREASKTTAAKRWVLWLCAYSGARVREMIQLRKEDVRQEDGHWIIRLTPEAGDIKTDEFRDVPIHQHLIETGFIEFVRSAPTGHLFCDVSKDGTINGPAEGVYSRLRAFTRSIITDKNVQPMHAWRYTFKTRGLEAGIEALVLDAICGHAPSHIGAAYMQVTLKKRIEALDQFPRYPLTS